jgi:hypothetical protein
MRNNRMAAVSFGLGFMAASSKRLRANKTAARYKLTAARCLGHGVWENLGSILGRAI